MCQGSNFSITSIVLEGLGKLAFFWLKTYDGQLSSEVWYIIVYFPNDSIMRKKRFKCTYRILVYFLSLAMSSQEVLFLFLSFLGGGGVGSTLVTLKGYYCLFAQKSLLEGFEDHMDTTELFRSWDACEYPGHYGDVGITRTIAIHAWRPPEMHLVLLREP